MRRQPVPRDSDAVIAVKERLKPVDNFKMFAKDSHGTLCEYRNDGSFIPTKVTGLPEDDIKKLNKGIAEQKVFVWVCQDHGQLAIMSGRGWRPAKRSELEVIAPFTYGNEADDLYHHVDSILCWRPRELDAQERIQLRTYNQQLTGGLDNIETGHGIQQSELEVTPDEPFTISQPVK